MCQADRIQSRPTSPITVSHPDGVLNGALLREAAGAVAVRESDNDLLMRKSARRKCSAQGARHEAADRERAHLTGPPRPRARQSARPEWIRRQ